MKVAFALNAAPVAIKARGRLFSDAVEAIRAAPMVGSEYQAVDSTAGVNVQAAPHRTALARRAHLGFVCPRVSAENARVLPLQLAERAR